MSKKQTTKTITLHRYTGKPTTKYKPGMFVSEQYADKNPNKTQKEITKLVK